MPSKIPQLYKQSAFSGSQRLSLSQQEHDQSWAKTDNNFSFYRLQIIEILK